MVQFWLDYLPDLFANNFTFLNNDPKTENYIKVLNLVSLIAIIVGLTLTFVKRKSVYFAVTVLVLSLCILIKSNTVSNFVPIPDPLNSKLSNTYDTGVYLTKAVVNDPSKLNNILFVNSVLNFNKGDIIALGVNGNIMETNIVSDLQYTTEPGPNGSGMPVIVLLNNLKKEYSKYTTKILKVSDSSPNIIPPPDGNVSIQQAGVYPRGMSDSQSLALDRFPKPELPNANRYDWNLELSTGVNGLPNNYVYQGPPYGDLKGREPDVHNPMGSIQVPEYDNAPTMFGTCNTQEMNGSSGQINDITMTRDQEATVSQRVDDLLFHKGNSQWHYSPMPADTIPNDQEGFAHFLYRNPTNLVNPKYGSIFVNEPEKLRLVMRLAKPQGNEGGPGNR